jgi:two-component system, sensor histidine kinase and response regulator
MNTRPRQPATILVTDDSPVTIQSITSILEENGYRVLTARNGTAALDLLKTELPDLIILDIDMPVLGGYDTCQKIKENDPTREIPVIFISGFDETFDKVKGFSCGAVDYLVKPVAREELLVRVHTHLTLRMMQKEILEINAALLQENRTRIFTEARLKARIAELENEITQMKRRPDRGASLSGSDTKPQE